MATKNDNLALARKLDEAKIDDILARVSKNSEFIDKMVTGIVSQYSQELDDLMASIKDSLGTVANPPTDVELDQMALKLPVTMFYIGEAQESLGVREDVAKAMKTEIYNKVHGETAGTIADKQAKAELASQQEYVVNVIYSRAYKQIKLKMDLALEVLASVKKVISRRMMEMQITNSSSQSQSYSENETRREVNFDE